MEELISRETIASILQLGGQYALPAAALLRALYAGIRGKLPEGLTQIALASVFAGITAIVDPNVAFDWRATILELLGNTFFMAGLLSFIVLYLLRMQSRGIYFDAFIGGAAGLVAWAFWTQILLNDWPWWTAPLVVIAGGAAFVALRFSLRQIARLVRIATYLVIVGIILVIGAGGIFALQWITTQAAG